MITAGYVPAKNEQPVILVRMASEWQSTAV